MRLNPVGIVAGTAAGLVTAILITFTYPPEARNLPLVLGGWGWACFVALLYGIADFQRTEGWTIVDRIGAMTPSQREEYFQLRARQRWGPPGF